MNIYSKNKHFIFLSSYLFILIVLLFISYLIFGGNVNTFSPLAISDVVLYKNISDKIILGWIPYTNFHFEYPPLSALFFVLPRIFTSNFIVYMYIFSIISLLTAYFCIFISYKILKLYYQKFDFKRIFLYCLIFILLYLILIIFRYDIYSAFFTALGIFLYLLSYKIKNKTYHLLSYIVIVLGGLLKLYPFLILPIFFISDLKQNNLKAFFKTVIYGCVLIILNFYFIICAIPGILFFLKFHSGRGIHIESFYSSIILFLYNNGIISDVSVVHNFCSLNLSGHIPILLSRLYPYIFFIIYCSFIFFVFKRINWSKNLPKNIIFSSTIVILIFVLFNKVFSPQYLLWLFPMIFMLDVFNNKKYTISFIFLIATFLSVLIFPIYYEALVSLNYLIVLVLLIRNVLLLVILIMTIKSLFINQEKIDKLDEVNI